MLYLFSFIILIIGSFFTSLCIIGNLSVNIVFSIFSIILVFIFLILNIKKVISLEVKRTNIIPVFFILIYFTIYFCFNKNFSQKLVALLLMLRAIGKNRFGVIWLNQTIWVQNKQDLTNCLPSHALQIWLDYHKKEILLNIERTH